MNLKKNDSQTFVGNEPTPNRTFCSIQFLENYSYFDTKGTFFFLHFEYYHMQDSAKHFPYITIIIPLGTIYLTVLGLSKTYMYITQKHNSVFCKNCYHKPINVQPSNLDTIRPSQKPPANKIFRIPDSFVCLKSSYRKSQTFLWKPQRINSIF